MHDAAGADLVQRPVRLTRVVYAVISLKVVRMLPVWLARLGTRVDSRSVLFMGAGSVPTALASIVFALLAIEELGEGRWWSGPSPPCP